MSASYATATSIHERPRSARDRVVAALAAGLRSVRELPTGCVGMTAGGQELRIEHAPGLAGDWLVLRTPICDAVAMDPVLVLERNACLAFAAIVLSGGLYWLRVALPVDSHELDDPARVIALVTDAAALLAPRPDAGVGSSHMFDHFTT